MQSIGVGGMPQSHSKYGPPFGRGHETPLEVVLLGLQGSVTIAAPQNALVRVVEWLTGTGRQSLRQWNCDAPVRRLGSSPRGGSLTHRVIGCTACPHSEPPSTRR